MAEREECLEGKADGAPQWAAGVQHHEAGKRLGQLVCTSPPRTLAGTLTSSHLVFLNPPRQSSPHGLPEVLLRSHCCPAPESRKLGAPP